MTVIVSAPLPGDAVTRLAQSHTVRIGSRAEGLGREGLLEMAAHETGVRALVTLVSDRVDDAVLAAFPGLAVVANFGVGTDNVDLAAARARGVRVTNTPDVLTDATADLTFALILAAARRVIEGSDLVRAGAWTGWSPTQLLGTEVTGATLGIVGLGRIGRAVVERAKGFRMRVLATTRTPGQSPPGVNVVPLDQLLAESDFVSLHCALTPETRGLIDARALARMKPTAFLVNTARGAIVDEPALADALHRGALGGCALDVYAREPEITPALLTAPNAVLLPHLGSASRTAREGMARIACENADAVLSGREPPNPVV